MSIREEQPEQPRAKRQGANRQKETGAGDVVQPPLQRYWIDTASGLPLLPDEQPVTTVRDSLYDLIPLGPREMKLISTAPFLRLQKIKQLGFVYRIWPGATHTRYEHSLGAYHLAVRAVRALLREEGGLTGIATSSVQTLIVAALLHDIGHYPFSHTIEELGYPIVLHEKVGRSIIENSEIAAILERDYRLSPERVADFIDPPRNKARLADEADDELLSSLLSGALDVDKLDYLPRDARACNVPYGGVDVTRLLGSLRVLTVDGVRRLGVSDKGISPLNSLLHARQEMFDNVYWHHTNRAMMAMLLRAVQEAMEAGQLAPEDLYGQDDASLLALFSQERMPEGTRALVGALRMRRPYKVLLEVSARAGRLFNQLDALFWDQPKRRRVEMALAGSLNEALDMPVAPTDVLVDVPKPEKWEMDVQVSFKRPPVGMAAQMSWADATGQRPSDLGIYEQHQRRIRIVSCEPLRDAIHAQSQAEQLLLPVLERLPML